MPPYRMIGKVSILNKQTSLLIFDKHPSTDSPTALQNREEEMNKSISEDKSRIEKDWLTTLEDSLDSYQRLRASLLGNSTTTIVCNTTELALQIPDFNNQEHFLGFRECQDGESPVIK